MLSMTDRYLIRYFLAVVDNGNFSRAAGSLNVTQPTLSAGIAKLESQLDATLFHRNNRRVHLTEAGSRFLPFARRIENEFNLSIAAVKAITPKRSLRIGILNTVSMKSVSPAIRTMLDADADLSIELLDGSERELIGKLAQGRLDFAITLVDRGSQRFEEVELFEEGYCIALSSSHSFAEYEEVNAHQLADETMIVRRQCEALSETSRFFTEQGIRPFFAYRSSQEEKVLELVAAGLGLTVIPRSHSHQGVSRVTLNGFNTKRKIGLMFSHSTDTDAILNLESVQILRSTLVAL